MRPFEDILDGYFPLRISVADLMQRRKLQNAEMELSFAPIIEVEGLPHDAPVPLNIRSGRGGMIHAAKLTVCLTRQEAELSGYAHWQWLDGTAIRDFLDPMTRLAEPALVTVHPKAIANPAPTDVMPRIIPFP